VQYLHDHNVCHYDISLENLLISDVDIDFGEDCDDKMKFSNTDNVVLKLCDFGLAEMSNFDDDESHKKSTKYCGKSNYQSPECTAKKPFNAKSNDIWCVGVCLFMMLIGGNMVKRASMKDKAFRQIITGNIDKLLTKWKRIKYVDPEIIDLLNKIFVPEEKRIDIQGIKEHSWLNHKL